MLCNYMTYCVLIALTCLLYTHNIAMTVILHVEIIYYAYLILSVKTFSIEFENYLKSCPLASRVRMKTPQRCSIRKQQYSTSRRPNISQAIFSRKGIVNKNPFSLWIIQSFIVCDRRSRDLKFKTPRGRSS